MTDVDLGGPTFVLNDQDYQEIRKYTKPKHIVSQFGFDLKHKKICQHWKKQQIKLTNLLKQEVKP